MASWPWTGYSPDFTQGIPRRSKAFFASTLNRVKIKILLSFNCSSKRGIDFGLGRGFSGSQAAKHFMGIAAAQYSGKSSSGAIDSAVPDSILTFLTAPQK